jgi:hypothetical protein
MQTACARERGPEEREMKVNIKSTAGTSVSGIEVIQDHSNAC